MSERRPYDGYAPNEPATPEEGYGKKPLAPAAQLTGAGATRTGAANGARQAPNTAKRTATLNAAYSRRTWDEAEYLPNEETPTPEKTEATARRAQSENPYTRPTWDETAYDPASEGDNRARASRKEAYGGYEEEPTPPAAPVAYFDRYGDIDSATAPAAENQPSPKTQEVINRYARPVGDVDGVSDLSARFAPPIKFELPKAMYADPEEQDDEPYQAQPNVYRTRRPTAYQHADAEFNSTRGDAYRVEADAAAPRRRRAIRRTLLVLLVIAAIGAAAYLNRAWILQQLTPLLGEETVKTVNQVVNPDTAGGQTHTAAYDPAPALQAGDQAKKGINAVAGGIGLETYAVTNSNVIARVQTAQGVYDYYLFASGNGKLLGYYEGLTENGFLVCPDDIYYVAQPPYLIDSNGLPLIDPSRYSQNAGADAVIGPMINGWAIIASADGTKRNYINENGEMLSTLWFAKAFPFTANSTLAYVDTGNVSDPTERYALYELTQEGQMKMWEHTADMNGVLGCATGLACMQTGELITLDGTKTVLCTSDSVTAYVDCGAVVARDPSTGRYGLFVNGMQKYGFDYESIAPVPSDIQWTTTQNGLYQQATVTGLAYPLPLSHYFALQKNGEQEMVALSTRSVYPLLLTDEK
ncbi:MAG TPA: hypothetical protein PLP25_08545 [Candidatus Limiplasma sp.]|nr:hypothetical protein [Candidatus Limiplasma sp.]HPS81890.1 hypothetical protein [Candidatus Limiplasma sp.]